MTNSYIFSDFDNLSLSINNKAYNVDSSNANWDEILDCIRANQLDGIPELINQAKALEAYANSAAVADFANIVVDVEYGTITYGGVDLHSAIVDHIFRMREEGFDIVPMLRFLDNLLSNPSKRAVDELYGFLQYGKMPITEDGCFIAYKRVRDDYKSVHDGKTDNSIGATVSMPRNLVDENSEQTCSTGLHFCSHEYLKSFSGDRVVILKINPRDVVSIPADYNNTKGRACQYEVVGELSPEDVRKALASNVFVDAVHNGNAPASKPAAYPNTAGPKKGTSTFFEGYARGYDDGDAECEYDEWNAYEGRLGTNFEEGYDKGYHDAYEEGIPRRYEFDNGTTAVEDDDVATYTDRQMYEVGYHDGRLRTGERYGHAHYVQGYKDGRGHKARKYR